MAHFGAVVFDMDGLLLDSERPLLDAWVQAARELDHPFHPHLLASVLGRPGEDGVAMFRASLPADFPYERVGKRARELLAAVREAGYGVKAGARELLEKLREASVPCAVASSTRREQIGSHLDKAGLLPFFQAIAAGDEVQNGKPAPDIFLLAAERLAVAPETCLVFEDSEHGARGALAANMQVVIVPDVNQPGDEARAFCLRVLDSLAQVDLQAWF
ncbi:MAG TPA: HAD family phosphatase [Polyangiales bacterium]|nr:HAD family phosphatase [Polyangiales bacterium]